MKIWSRYGRHWCLIFRVHRDILNLSFEDEGVMYVNLPPANNSIAEIDRLTPAMAWNITQVFFLPYLNKAFNHNRKAKPSIKRQGLYRRGILIKWDVKYEYIVLCVDFKNLICNNHIHVPVLLGILNVSSSCWSATHFHLSVMGHLAVRIFLYYSQTYREVINHFMLLIFKFEMNYS